MKTIAVDVDEVIVNFNQAWRDLFVSQGHDLPKVSDVWPSLWDWPQAAGIPDKEVARIWDEIIMPSENFWSRMKPLPTGVEDLLALYALSFDHRVYFVTQRVGNGVLWQTSQWLDSHGFYRPSVIVVNRGRSKAPVVKALEADMFIDDKPANFNELPSGIHRWLFDRPHNQDACRKCYYGRVSSVTEMLKEEGLI